MISVTLFFSFAILNVLRGLSVLSRWTACLIMAMIVLFIATFFSYYDNGHLLAVSFTTAFGMLFGLSFGWGKYFAIFTGNMATIQESEVKPIDWLVNKMLGVPQTVKQLKWWSFVAFTLRGGLFYPLFIALAFYKPFALLYGLGVFSMGIAFGLMNLIPEKYAPAGGHFLYGGILGYLISLSL